MKKKNGKQNKICDYDMIYELYGIKRSQYDKNELKRLTQYISRNFRKYLKDINCEKLTWNDLSQQRIDYFVCTVIKDYMMEEAKAKSSGSVAKKNIEEYLLNNIAQAEKNIEDKNDTIDNLRKRDYFDENSRNEKKEEAYKQFCKNWEKLTFQPVPSYKTFLKNPNLSIHDYLMAEKFTPLDYDIEVYRQKMNEIVLNIVVEILSKLVDLKIDYDTIQESLEYILSQRNDECSELMEMYQFEPFEYSREEYVNNVIKGREQEYSEEDIENLKQDYDNLQNRMLESFYHMERLRNLEKLYKVNEKKINNFKRSTIK